MTGARIFKAGVLFLLIVLALSETSAQTAMQARIYFSDKSQMKEIWRLNLDIAYVKYGQYVDIVTSQEEVSRLRTLGYNVEKIHEDLVAFYQSRFEKAKDMGGYHTYSEVNAALDSMHTFYPSITSSRINIGSTLEGRAIWAFKISDNPAMDENEPEVYYNALTHAREPIGMEVLLYFMWHLLHNYGTDSLATYLVNNRELWFVPVVNPDGYEYNQQTNPNGGGMWRKNRRNCGSGHGIDLNRNFGYMWGYDDEGSSPYCSDETYRGSGPFSEPETQVIRDFVNSRNFVMCLDNHAYGMYLLYPWGYDRLYTPHQNLFVAIAETMAVFNSHSIGTSWELLYPTNGASDDWEYGDTASRPMILAISPEIGTEDDGFWPPSSRILPLCQLELPAHLVHANLADNPYKLLPPVAPNLKQIDTVSQNYTVSWSFHDTLNPASVFELVEMSGFQRTTYDVESGYSDWDLKGFSVSSARSHSPTHSFYSGSGNNLNGRVTSVNTVKVLPGDSLKIWCWYNIENNWDYAYVEISTNGGSSFFSIPGNITTNNNPNGTNLGNGITGSSGGWIEGKFDLNSYAGQETYIRLHYMTDGYLSYEGFYADDFFPFERYQSVVSLSSAITDTFYQISEQDEGTYFYKVRAKDAQNQWGAWSNIEKAIVEISFVRGDADGNGTVEVGDVIYLINYLFKAGPVPSPFEAGDANCDSKINIGDAVYLINYLFKGGPAPGC